MHGLKVRVVKCPLFTVNFMLAFVLLVAKVTKFTGVLGLKLMFNLFSFTFSVPKVLKVAGFAD